MDFYSQGGFALSICSQARYDSEKKKINSNLLSLRGFIG